MLLHLPVAEEIERDDVSVLVRVLPLLEDDEPTGALVLLRDVSDLRRRDRHAALEGRDDPRDPPPGEEQPADDRVAAAAAGPAAAIARGAGRAGGVGAADPLDRDRARDAVARGRRRRRVQRDRAAARPARRGDRRRRPSITIRFNVEGDAGELPGEVATPLAVVLNELMQNAVDHAFPEGVADARVEVTLARDDGHVEIEVRDNGAGLPEQFTLDGSRGLGLSIVQALVTSELRARSRCTTTTARRCASASRSRCRASSSRAVEAGGLADAGVGDVSRPLRSRRRSSSVRPPHTPASWFVAERELEALVGDRALRRTPAWRRRSGRARRPVVPIGKKSSGLVSRQAARSRHSSASQSWVRIQVNATFCSPLRVAQSQRALRSCRTLVRPMHTVVPRVTRAARRREHAG